ncbi:4-amino-4-deoxychorismate lyase [Hypnocyclicus thermotrophus]|uniref:4-amino-4-deoxychorismate lyase n=1 Tax=Hypnocyclicus thermotrophus TaxID=1627895 RepID=A0AA46DXP9_9FUSO|nr:aminotransferase class IV [Hypnocyclicus thermotrophus]TDT68613.1 4-amino-4-deoxychorismate lyase [Hypnocyclicus thermotrophus]
MYYLNEKIYNKSPLGEDYFYGISLFETIMGYKNKLIFLDEHLKRLENSMKFIGIDKKIEKNYLYDLINQEKDLNDEFMLKIQVSSENLFIKIENFSHRYFKNGIKLVEIVKYYQSELGFLKSGNYLLNILARKEVMKENGFEGVFRNRNNIITEGTISNIFFIKDEIVFTPSLDLNILNGIVREKIIEILKKNGIKVQEGHYTSKNLLEADSIFISNSLMKLGCLWVSEYNNIYYKKSEIIHLIEKEYLKLIKSMI